MYVLEQGVKMSYNFSGLGLRIRRRFILFPGYRFQVTVQNIFAFLDIPLNIVLMKILIKLIKRYIVSR